MARRGTRGPFRIARVLRHARFSLRLISPFALRVPRFRVFGSADTFKNIFLIFFWFLYMLLYLSLLLYSSAVFMFLRLNSSCLVSIAFSGLWFSKYCH